ncbi:class I SAM-dependent methyltransferase [Planctomycetota bacterium]
MKTYNYDSDYLVSLTEKWTRASFPIISRFVRNMVKMNAPRRLLDFGCGAGVYAEALSDLGGEVSACDISEDCIAACVGKYSSVFLLTEPADLPFNHFDMIFSTEVLEHIKDYNNVIRHFYRTLRLNGIVLLTTSAYSTSVFTMLYQAKKAGVGFMGIL